jgi:hypothetical protein
MKNDGHNEEGDATLVRARRIIVSDDLPVLPREVRGRRLDSPTPERSSNPGTSVPIDFKLQRRPKVLATLGVGVLLIAAIAVFAFIHFKAPRVSEKPTAILAANINSEPTAVVAQPRDLQRIEEQAKQVIRVMSRDNRPYSFSEKSLKEIQSRSVELGHSPQLPVSLRAFQTNGERVASRALAEGLQPSLVILLGLALTKGGELGDGVKAATDALPLLVSLNKTFGSNEGDSCLLLIAAFREGTGTRRSHPLLRRINKVVTNPLTERNVWYLNEQRIFSADAYALVIDTIAFGVITRSPREFGVDSDPLNF